MTIDDVVWTVLCVVCVFCSQMQSNYTVDRSSPYQEALSLRLTRVHEFCVSVVEKFNAKAYKRCVIDVSVRCGSCVPCVRDVGADVGD